MKTTRKALGALAVGLMGAGALAACAPEPAPAPPTTVPGGNTTTTTTVTLACAGSGIIGPGGASPVGPIADQDVDIDITLPNSVTAGANFSVGVDVGNLALAAAPGFINLNGAGIDATIFMTGSSNIVVPANNFVGNGASLDLVEGIGTATAASGTNTVEVGQINILSGTTGFVCTPASAPATASVEAV